MSMDSAANATTKDWHASKHIGKRARYLLKHPDEEIPSDVSFLVGDGQNEPQKIFKCHKFLLAMVSSMFQTMFYGTFPQTDGPVKIPDVTPTAFQNMLRYAYGEIIDDVGSLEDALDTLHCAKMYLIDKLADICRDRIHYLLGTFQEDPCVVFQRAPQMDEEDLAALALARIALNTTDILQGEGLLRLSIDCLQTIVDYPHLNAEEPDIYQGVRRWVEHNVATVKDCTLLDAFGSLLYSINFPLFTPFKLTDTPAADGILRAEEVSRIAQFLLADMTPVLPFLITPSSPLPAPLLCIFDRSTFYARLQELRPGRANHFEQDSTVLLMEARPDLAPECCAFLRHLLEAKFDIGIAFYGDSHPRSCCYAFGSNSAPVPAAVADECSVVPHSAEGACWFEWDVGPYNAYKVRIGVGRKPHLYHSAVFGFLLGFEDNENQWEPFASWDDKRVEEVAGFNMLLSKIT